MAELHPQLARDCLLIGSFPLCLLLLMRDANYPWFILVPDRPGLTEIHELAEPDQVLLLRESGRLARLLKRHWGADKLNIAALGNAVPQLHIHHIARYRGDPAWPAPVWGRVPPKPYGETALAGVIARLKGSLTEEFRFLV